MAATLTDATRAILDARPGPARELVEAYIHAAEAAGQAFTGGPATVSGHFAALDTQTRCGDRLHEAICAGELHIEPASSDPARASITWPWTQTGDVAKLLARGNYNAALRAADDADDANRIADRIAARGDYDAKARQVIVRVGAGHLTDAALIQLAYQYRDPAGTLEWLANLSETAHRRALAATASLGTYYGPPLIDAALYTPERYDTHGRHIPAAVLRDLTHTRTAELCANAVRHWIVDGDHTRGRIYDELWPTWAGTVGELEHTTVELAGRQAR